MSGVRPRKPPKPLTQSEAAELLGVTPRTLQRWHAAGKGPEAIRLSPRRVVYTRAAILRFKRAREATP